MQYEQYYILHIYGLVLLYIGKHCPPIIIYPVLQTMHSNCFCNFGLYYIIYPIYPYYRQFCYNGIPNWKGSTQYVYDVVVFTCLK
jgi:hypothetical protein